MILASNVRELIEAGHNAYWQISYGRNKAGSKIFSSTDLADSEESPIDLEESLNHLDVCMENLMPGKYTIRYWNDPKKSARGYGEVIFVVQGQSGNNGNNAIGNANGIYGNNIGAVIEEKVQAALDRKELEELRDEVEEYRKAGIDPSGTQTQVAKVLEKITSMPGSDMLIAGLFKGIVDRFTRPAVISNGHWPNEHAPAQLDYPAAQAMFNGMSGNSNGTDPIVADLEAHENDYAAVLLRLRTHVPTLLEVLQLLADKAEQDPKGFNEKLGLLSML